MHLAHMNEFAPQKLSRCEQVEQLNRIIDKLSDFL